MIICFFGDYDPEYARNRVLIKGLRQGGAKVIECNDRTVGWKKYYNLFRRHYKIKDDYDLMIAGYSVNRSIAPFARMLTRKPIVWDIFYSKYDVWVFDKKIVKPLGVKAAYHWFWDWLGCRLSDRILLDTNEHIGYISRLFKVKKEKFIRAFIGADDSVFFPHHKREKPDIFVVHFHGNFIPVQGIEYVIKAAKLLEARKDIRFNLVGSGQEISMAKSLAAEFGLENLEFYGRRPYAEMPGFLTSSQVSLGNFGDTDKVLRVIANKTFETIACAVAHISADAPAMRELFTDREDILFCRRADPEDLAEKILELKNDSFLRQKIAAGGYELFLKSATPQVIGEKLIRDLALLLKTAQA